MLKHIKRNLPVYVLSSSLIFLGIAINTNNASAAYDPNAAKILKLQNQFNAFRMCVNNNLVTIGFYDPNSGRRMFVVPC